MYPYNTYLCIHKPSEPLQICSASPLLIILKLWPEYVKVEPGLGGEGHASLEQERTLLRGVCCQCLEVTVAVLLVAESLLPAEYDERPVKPGRLGLGSPFGYSTCRVGATVQVKV